jgi:long-chain fatty acid transport protein
MLLGLGPGFPDAALADASRASSEKSTRGETKMTDLRRFLTNAAKPLLFILCLPTLAAASGFGIFTHGASSLGQAASVVAHTSGPAAIFFNPALINKLEGTQVEVGTTLIVPSREYTGRFPGQRTDTRDDVFLPSTLFVTHRFSDRISAGLGVFSPFGLGTDWGGTWDGRYLATRSEMITLNVNPVISCLITPQLALAAGIDILYLDTTLERKLNLNGLNAAIGGLLGAGPFPDVGQKFSGDGTGIGFNLGLLYDVSDTISLGASYRSEIKVGVKGKGTFDPQIPGLLTDSPGKADLTLPQQVFAGICYKGFDPLTLEAGIRWEDWSSFRELVVNSDNGTVSYAPKNWKSTFAYTIGARYRLNDTVALLAGYLYSDNPIPDGTFEPSIPDADTHLFCVGADLDYRTFIISISYAYQMLESRDKGNLMGDPFGVPGTGTANGRYESDLHMVAASVAFRF